MRIRVVSAAVVALLAALSLAGCTAGGSASGGSAAGGSVQADGRAAGSASAAGAKAPADRSVVTTGSLTLVDDHPVRVADRIGALVEAAGGSVARSREQPGDEASATLTLRIPAASFPRTLAAVEREARRVRTVSVGATDVTAQVTDYGVRIANLRTSIARLQQLLSRAASSAALVDLEGALTERQTSLERLLAEQRDLADRVALATLDVQVVPPAAVPARGPGDFAAGFLAGLDGLAAAAAAVAIGAGVALPWVLVLAALGGAALLVARRVRRARSA